MPLLGTRGAASAQGFGEFAQQTAANYIEDVFSTYLYTGNGSTLAINNGVDLSTYGGLVWVKRRDATIAHGLWDTARGVGTGTSNATNKALATNSTSAEGLGNLYPGEDIDYLSAFATNGFTVKSNALGGRAIADGNGGTYASWTFRKQAKFFDVVTWTGNGTNNRQISHALGSAPGCIIVKELNQTGEWYVYHRSTGTGGYTRLNSTASLTTSAAYFPAVSSTTFTPTSDTQLNTSSVTYVAYLFAHNAGGFGASGNDNVISCGSFVSTGANQRVDVDLGYQPQWLLVKRSDGTGSQWYLLDSMRGFPAVNVESSNDPTSRTLYANLSNAEGDFSIALRTNGFSMPGGQFSSAGETYIYIAIRRGPMKTPTSGTSVFTPVTATASNNLSVTAGFPPDLAFVEARVDGVTRNVIDRLRGGTTTSIISLESASTGAEQTYSGNGISFNSNSTGIIDNFTNFNQGAISMVYWMFRRAPSFMDEVCYAGTSATQTINHNLGVVPELIILKRRSSASSWPVWRTATGTGTSFIYLNDASGDADQGVNILTATPTTTAMSLSSWGGINGSGSTYVAYLFASCPGVSKVGSYTGTGGTQTISCGFAARWVMIKRTDSTGNWWVWDTARGMVAGTDPRLTLNSTTAESNANWVYTNASGFQIVTTDATVNASGGTYIYLAIA